MQSINSVLKNQGKLMSISSIIAEPYPMQRRTSAPSHPYQHPHHFPLFRSPPDSPEPSSPSSPSSPRHVRRTDDDEEDAPLTLEERRLRNKAASAKYRQKKNQQQSEMKHMIGKLSEKNAVLERQLQELKLENERLKITSDKLRGKIVARKMLKKWMGRQTSDVSYDVLPYIHSSDYNSLEFSNSEQEDDLISD